MKTKTMMLLGCLLFWLLPISSFASYGTVSVSLCGSGFISTGGNGSPGTGEENDPILGEPDVDSTNVHLVRTSVKNGSQRNYHPKSGWDNAFPGRTTTVYVETRVQNRGSHLDEFYTELGVTTKKLFRRSGMKVVTHEDMRDSELEDFKHDAKDNEHESFKITLNSDNKSIRVFGAKGSYTFQITDKHRREGYIPVYVYSYIKGRRGHRVDKDISNPHTDEYAKFKVHLPWFRSRFKLDNILIKEGESIIFTNLSSGSTGAIKSYLWDFGDGYTSTATSPVHRFDVPGTYTVSLTTTSAWGEKKVSRATVMVEEIIETKPDGDIKEVVVIHQDQSSNQDNPGWVHNHNTLSIEPGEEFTVKTSLTNLGNGDSSSIVLNLYLQGLPCKDDGNGQCKEVETQFQDKENSEKLVSLLGSATLNFLGSSNTESLTVSENNDGQKLTVPEKQGTYLVYACQRTEGDSNTGNDCSNPENIHEFATLLVEYQFCQTLNNLETQLNESREEVRQLVKSFWGYYKERSEYSKKMHAQWKLVWAKYLEYKEIRKDGGNWKEAWKEVWDEYKKYREYYAQYKTAHDKLISIYQAYKKTYADYKTLQKDYAQKAEKCSDIL